MTEKPEIKTMPLVTVQVINRKIFEQIQTNTLAHETERARHAEATHLAYIPVGNQVLCQDKAGKFYRVPGYCYLTNGSDAFSMGEIEAVRMKMQELPEVYLK